MGYWLFKIRHIIFKLFSTQIRPSVLMIGDSLEVMQIFWAKTLFYGPLANKDGVPLLD